MDPFSIRAPLLSQRHQKMLWSLSDAYIQAHKEGKTAALSVASAPLGLGIEERVETTIFVESKSNVVIYTGFSDDAHHLRIAKQLQQATGISSDAICVVCSTAFQSNSGPDIADRSRWLGVLSMQKAIQKLQNALHGDWGLELLQGQWFVGIAHHKPEKDFAARGFVASVAVLDAKGHPETIHLAADFGDEDNHTWALSCTETAAQHGVSLAMGEGFVYDKNGLPPKSLDQLSILDFKDTPTLSIRFYPSIGCVPFADAAFCAAFASVQIARDRHRSFQQGQQYDRTIPSDIKTHLHRRI